MLNSGRHSGVTYLRQVDWRILQVEPAGKGVNLTAARGCKTGVEMEGRVEDLRLGGDERQSPTAM